MTALGDRHRLARELRRHDPFRPIGRKTAIVRKARRSSIEVVGDKVDHVLEMRLPWHKSVPGSLNFGIIGVAILKVGDHQYVTVTGKARDWVIGQAMTFLTKAGIDRLEATIRKGDSRRTRAIWIDGRQYMEKDDQGVRGLRLLPMG